MKKEKLKKFREHIKQLIELDVKDNNIIGSIENVINRALRDQALSPNDVVDFIAILAETATARRIVSSPKKHQSDNLEHLLKELEPGDDCDQPAISEDGLLETELISPGVYTEEYDDGSH